MSYLYIVKTNGQNYKFNIEKDTLIEYMQACISHFLFHPLKDLDAVNDIKAFQPGSFDETERDTINLVGSTYEIVEVTETVEIEKKAEQVAFENPQSAEELKALAEDKIIAEETAKIEAMQEVAQEIVEVTETVEKKAKK